MKLRHMTQRQWLADSESRLADWRDGVFEEVETSAQDLLQEVVADYREAVEMALEKYVCGRFSSALTSRVRAHLLSHHPYQWVMAQSEEEDLILSLLWERGVETEDRIDCPHLVVLLPAALERFWWKGAGEGEDDWGSLHQEHNPADGVPWGALYRAVSPVFWRLLAGEHFERVNPPGVHEPGVFYYLLQPSQRVLEQARGALL